MGAAATRSPAGLLALSPARPLALSCVSFSRPRLSAYKFSTLSPGLTFPPPTSPSPTSILPPSLLPPPSYLYPTSSIPPLSYLFLPQPRDERLLLVINAQPPPPARPGGPKAEPEFEFFLRRRGGGVGLKKDWEMKVNKWFFESKMDAGPRYSVIYSHPGLE